MPTLRDTNPPHLWRIGYVLAASVLIAFAGLALLWWLADADLRARRRQRRPVSGGHGVRSSAHPAAWRRPGTACSASSFARFAGGQGPTFFHVCGAQVARATAAP